MNAHADHVLSEALALEPDERSIVLLSLLDSLQGDGAPEDEVTQAWVDEARRRGEDLRAGRAVAMPLAEFRGWLNAL
ncbi:hypothetical protein BH11PSE9_BH11PSE9_36350 [soil metagenome]